MNHDIKVGTIFYSAWGYEQTNIDYYQVVKTTPKCVYIRAINDKENYCGESMTGTKKPHINNFKNETIMRKKVQSHRDEILIAIGHSFGHLYDGKPKEFSTYG